MGLHPFLPSRIFRVRRAWKRTVPVAECVYFSKNLSLSFSVSRIFRFWRAWKRTDPVAKCVYFSNKLSVCYIVCRSKGDGCTCQGRSCFVGEVKPCLVGLRAVTTRLCACAATCRLCTLD